MKDKIIWVLINSNSRQEAERIGNTVLKERLAACFSLIPKLNNVYYWPPKSNKLQSNKGPQLILETLPRNYPKIIKRVKELHSDKVPIIGKLVIDAVNPDFYNWMKGEIR